MSFGLRLGGVTKEGTMICNLPLLFADGYPTCLEKMTVSQLEKFVPFMVQCSSGRESSQKMTTPVWWPENVKFSIPLVKPPGEEAKWLSHLKNIVCRCYEYHGCEFMLRFCTDLSQWHASDLFFADSWNGTTSLHSKVNGKLLVTFRNENMSYDKKKESPRKTLLPRVDSHVGRSQIMVQPPLFDIYLCENCDDEFSSLKEVQEHEKVCSRDHAVSSPHPSTEKSDSEPTVQETFFNYFELGFSTNGKVKRAVQNVDPPRYKKAVRNSLRYTSIPFSSPLGILVHKNLRSVPEVPRELEKIERFCSNKPLEVNGRSRESRHEGWPVSWKSRKKTDGSEEWVHLYKFPKRQFIRRAPFMETGLNEKSRRLLADCRPAYIKVKKLTNDEIELHTAPRLATSVRSCDRSMDTDNGSVVRHQIMFPPAAARCAATSNSPSCSTSYSNQRENKSRRSQPVADSILKLQPKGTSSYAVSKVAHSNDVHQRTVLEHLNGHQVVNGEATENVNSATKSCSVNTSDSQLLPNTPYVYDESSTVKHMSEETRAIPVVDLCSSDDEIPSSSDDIARVRFDSRPSGRVSKRANYSLPVRKVAAQSASSVNHKKGAQNDSFKSSLPRVARSVSSSETDSYVKRVTDSGLSPTACRKDSPESKRQRIQLQSRKQGVGSLPASCGSSAAHRVFPQECCPVEAEVACDIPVQERSAKWTQGQREFHCTSNVEKLPKVQKHRRCM